MARGERSANGSLRSSNPWRGVLKNKHRLPIACRRRSSDNAAVSHEKPRRQILIVNAGLNGDQGNTAALLRRAKAHLVGQVDVAEVTLAAGAFYPEVRRELARSDALLIGTGTHWDSWSHFLQRMLEEATPDEGTPLWLGKPVGVIVTMHSVGGKAVLSRLQGVLNTFGCLIPPMSGMVYSLVNQAALRTAEGEALGDVWSPEDVVIVCHNLLVALGLRTDYRAWPTDRSQYAATWISGE
jgi:chromate reductase